MTLLEPEMHHEYRSSLGTLYLAAWYLLIISETVLDKPNTEVLLPIGLETDPEACQDHFGAFQILEEQR